MFKKIIHELTPPIVKRFYKLLTKKHYHPEWISLSGRHQGIFFYVDPATLLGKSLINGQDNFFYPIIDEILKGKKGEIIIYDIGAHFGYHSLGFAKMIGSKGYLYAFEPHPLNIIRLKLNIERNSQYAPRIKIIEKAISDHEGVASFKMYKNIEEGVSSASGIFESEGERGIDNELYKELQVNTTTLDSLIKANTVKPPDIIKIDIEGAEYKALIGASETIKGYKPQLLIEIHSIKNMYLILELLPKFNYTFQLISEEIDGRCFLYASPK